MIAQTGVKSAEAIQDGKLLTLEDICFELRSSRLRGEHLQRSGDVVIRLLSPLTFLRQAVKLKRLIIGITREDASDLSIAISSLATAE